MCLPASPRPQGKIPRHTRRSTDGALQCSLHACVRGSCGRPRRGGIKTSRAGRLRVETVSTMTMVGILVATTYTSLAKAPRPSGSALWRAPLAGSHAPIWSHAVRRANRPRARVAGDSTCRLVGWASPQAQWRGGIQGGTTVSFPESGHATGNAIRHSDPARLLLEWP